MKVVKSSFTGYLGDIRDARLRLGQARMERVDDSTPLHSRPRLAHFSVYQENESWRAEREDAAVSRTVLFLPFPRPRSN